MSLFPRWTSDCPPLEDTAFNRSRSDVKFLEYAAHGVVPVLQATGPYPLSVQDGKTGFLYRSIDELITILDKLAAEPSVMTQTARAARNYVQSQRDQLKRGYDRVEFYRGLLWRQKAPFALTAATPNKSLMNAANWPVPKGRAEMPF